MEKKNCKALGEHLALNYNYGAIVLVLCAVACPCQTLQLPVGPTLKTASRHPMQYYVSLPKDWTATKTWPLVVTLDGGNKDWQRNAERFGQSRDEGSYPFVLITPLILTNGGSDLRGLPAYHYPPAVWDEVERSGPCAFDMKGIEAITKEVRETYSGQPKYFLTGWSAGGHITWALVFQHPEQLLAAALAGGNYIGRCVDEAGSAAFSSSSDRVHLPVRILEGKDDPLLPKLGPQAQRAKELAVTHGYRGVDYVELPNVDHSPMPAEVLKYFYSVSRP